MLTNEQRYRAVSYDHAGHIREHCGSQHANLRAGCWISRVALVFSFGGLRCGPNRVRHSLSSILYVRMSDRSSKPPNHALSPRDPFGPPRNADSHPTPSAMINHIREPPHVMASSLLPALCESWELHLPSPLHTHTRSC